MIATKIKTKDPTAAELKAKLQELDEELRKADGAIEQFNAEKAPLAAAAYIQGDRLARARLDEINQAIGLEERRRGDISLTRGPLQEQHDAAAAKEQTEHDAARLRTLESAVPKASAAAQETERAVMDLAMQLKPLVARHRAAVGAWATAERLLSMAQGDDDDDAFVPSTELDAASMEEVATRAVRAAGLPTVLTSWELQVLRAGDEKAAVSAFWRGVHAERDAAKNGEQATMYLPPGPR